jgi:hypothetical protein
MKHVPHRLIFIGLIVLCFAVVFATSRGQATTPDDHAPNAEMANFLVAAQPESISGENLASLPPPAEQDPCLHCHIAGEIVNEWSPISRWLVFGAMGFTFIFGISRNMIVWRTRELWQHRWMYYFSSITALVFVLSAITGISVLLLNKATPEIIAQITAVIKAIHWGSGIALLITALGLSFAGALLPWHQRPFWAMIFITGIIGSALAVANLSFTYLYAEWHDPPAPGHLYALHILLIPIAMAGILSIYFVILRKRGENL